MSASDKPQLEFREWLGDQMDRRNMRDQQAAFADFVGVAQSSISDWLRGEGLPRRDSQMKLAHSLGIPIEEIRQVVSYTQRRRAAAQAGFVLGIEADLQVIPAATRPSQPLGTRYIPIIGTAAADSLRASWGVGDLFPVLSADVQGVGEPVMMVVSGDCMEPRIGDGSLVILDTTRTPVIGDVVAVRQGDSVTLKEYWSDDGEEIVLRAVKAGYAPIRINKEDQGAHLVGVVHLWYQKGKP